MNVDCTLAHALLILYITMLIICKFITSDIDYTISVLDINFSSFDNACKICAYLIDCNNNCKFEKNCAACRYLHTMYNRDIKLIIQKSPMSVIFKGDLYGSGR